MKKFVPIIRIIGLPGAGKTTLAKKLAKELKLSISEACQIFKERFSASGLNMYHVLKSIVFLRMLRMSRRQLSLWQGWNGSGKV